MLLCYGNTEVQDFTYNPKIKGSHTAKCTRETNWQKEYKFFEKHQKPFKDSFQPNFKFSFITFVTF
jgi:hypothetical protein